MVSVLVNGSPTVEFKMEKGVRQGDPLSPFLFLIVAEALNVMMLEAVENNLFTGVKVGDGNLVVSHLQYADDAIFIADWKKDNIVNLLRLLRCYELASGLRVNVSKSRLIGVGVSKEEVRRLASKVGCKEDQLPMTYLGLPVGENMNKSVAWQTVIGKINKKLNPWRCKVLSAGGRLTLLKSVLGSLPLYFFSLFRAPKSVMKLIESVRLNFSGEG